jgi:hypothetical protein
MGELNWPPARPGIPAYPLQEEARDFHGALFSIHALSYAGYVYQLEV